MADGPAGTSESTGGFTPTTPVPGGTSTTAPTPIGVPEGYRPPFTQVGPTGSTGESLSGPGSFGALDPGAGNYNMARTGLNTIPSKHVYVEGDQWGPVHERPADIKALQLQMVAAGLLDATQVHMGVWDLNSADAYKTVLAQANTYGAAAPDMLDALQQNAPAKLKGQKAPYALTNPLDIASAVRGAPPGSQDLAQKLTGADLPKSESQAFVKWYQDQEAQARDAYNSLDLTTHAAYTGPPSLDAAAQAYIKQHNLAQVTAYGTAARMFDFFGMLKGVV